VVQAGEVAETELEVQRLSLEAEEGPRGQKAMKQRSLGI